ncbi:hypothetical protein [Sphingobium sp.]|uniref:hypothetical protein n=1 Tax=Sphingobium sp. TaxID=1912891 RepID=UPI003BB7FA29
MIGLTGKTRWMTGALVGAGLMLGSVSAAEARPRYDRGYDRGGWGHHHRGRGDGFGFGDAVGVAALVGAVAIVASSVAKDKQARAADVRDYDGPPPSVGTEYGADVRSDVRDEADFSDVAATASRDDAMTDACAVAARDEAQGEAGGYAEVRHMDAPRATPDGYNIDGQVESRAAYRDTGGVTRRFTCAMRDGRVAQVYLSRDVAAR